jgi:GTP cyclohydrolase II
MVLELTQADPTTVRRWQRSVDRALSDLRRGEIVLVNGTDGRPVLALAAESASPDSLAALQRMAGSSTHLAITGQRAHALGLTSPGTGTLVEQPTVLLSFPGGLTAEMVRSLSDPSHSDLGRGEPMTQPPGRLLTALPARAGPERGGPERAGRDDTTAEAAALRLTRLARLLPAVLVAAPASRAAALELARRHDLLSVDASFIVDYDTRSARSLRQVVEAAVPLADADRVRIVGFRPSDGGDEHLAIIIGDIAAEAAAGRPVLVRLHSECFTGDLLGSLRCDCGPQLRGAIAAIAAEGSGVVLYLAQEGRGIGLINKLRAYRLQDGGLDTVDANTALGFDSDERVYRPAAAMLHSLGVDSVRLLTNNPDKLAQLERCGVTVSERVPHIFPANGHNAAYLRTKAERSGHLF